MKKSLFLSVLTGMVLTGCVNDEQMEVTNQDSLQKIVFNVPVAEANKKVSVYGEMSTPYSTSENFSVVAVRHNGDFVSWSDVGTTLFMDDVEVSYDASLNGWAPTMDYYWPKSQKVTFAAHSPSGIDADAESHSYTKDGLQLEGFKVNDDPALQYDLMYSKRTYNKVASTGGTLYQGVDIHFMHALASIKFKAKKSSTTDAEIKIKKIEVLGVNSKGNFNEGVNETTVSYANVPDWTDLSEIRDYTAFDGNIELTASEVEIGSGLILLPQTLTSSSYIKVTYTVNSGGVEHQEVKEVVLSDLSPATWRIGTRNTYIISIGVEKIYFSPEVSAWDDKQIVIPSF